jgi:hypothetical protein
VLHFPGQEKSADFQKAFQKKLANKDFDFRGVWFPDAAEFQVFTFAGKVNFNSATFSAAADFDDATFSADADFAATFNATAYFRGATFSAEADFGSATFNGEADFSAATFNAPAYFRRSTFGAAAIFNAAIFSAEADFHRATFIAPAYFRYATFSAEVDFISATFIAEAHFGYATFEDYVKFGAKEEEGSPTLASSLDFQFARVEKPDCVSFHTLTLRTHWFMNIDARRFDFTNVDWGGRPSVRKEIQSLETKGEVSPHRFLAIACRHLAVNSEDNNRYEEASKFRYMAMEARRLESWRGFAPWRLSWWYWLASGYGERSFQALMVLLGILLLFALFYTQVGFARWEPRIASEADVAVAKRDEIGASLKFSRALTYSAAVMTLQRPEPKPATTAAQTVVLLETILGPVQAALLALAIRRKFMR